MPPRRTRAFTLVELMLVLVIVGLVVGIAAPSMADAVGRERSRSARQGIPEQLELVLKEARNRLVPLEIDVDADGIFYRFNPQAAVALAFDSCEGSPGISSGCFLRQATPCPFLFHADVSDVCLPMRATMDGLLRTGDLDGALQLWPPNKAAAIVSENLSDAPPPLTQKIGHPLIRFAETFAEDGLTEANFLVTPLGRVLTRGPRTLRMFDDRGVETRLQILDSGIVRVEQP